MENLWGRERTGGTRVEKANEEGRGKRWRKKKKKEKRNKEEEEEGSKRRKKLRKKMEEEEEAYRSRTTGG